MEKIKILREKTGAGMIDCKKALEEAGGELDRAMEILREKGIAKAAKRSEREANEGVIKMTVSDDKNEGYILEVNSETDFVARNNDFQAFAENILKLITKEKPADMEALMALTVESGKTVEEELKHLSGVIGEKLEIGRFDIIKSEGTVSAYSHGSGVIGVLVALDKEGKDDLAYEVAMQIAASDPKYIAPEDVPEEEVEKEKEVYRQQLKEEGKPEDIIEKIIIGKINKYYEGICLIKQEYIKDDKKKVEDILDGVKVEKFVRYNLS